MRQHVGVVWEDLQVNVMGGVDYKVSDVYQRRADQHLMLYFISFMSGLWEVRMPSRIRSNNY
jgi:hypothetical protein